MERGIEEGRTWSTTVRSKTSKSAGETERRLSASHMRGGCSTDAGEGDGQAAIEFRTARWRIWASLCDGWEIGEIETVNCR
jgi:hypothetical protein